MKKIWLWVTKPLTNTAERFFGTLFFLSIPVLCFFFILLIDGTSHQIEDFLLMEGDYFPSFLGSLFWVGVLSLFLSYFHFLRPLCLLYSWIKTGSFPKPVTTNVSENVVPDYLYSQDPFDMILNQLVNEHIDILEAVSEIKLTKRKKLILAEALNFYFINLLDISPKTIVRFLNEHVRNALLERLKQLNNENELSMCVKNVFNSDPVSSLRWLEQELGICLGQKHSLFIAYVTNQVNHFSEDTYQQIKKSWLLSKHG